MNKDKAVEIFKSAKLNKSGSVNGNSIRCCRQTIVSEFMKAGASRDAALDMTSEIYRSIFTRSKGITTFR